MSVKTAVAMVMVMNQCDERTLRNIGRLSDRRSHWLSSFALVHSAMACQSSHRPSEETNEDLDVETEMDCE